jgi:uncharacterized protein (DUF427 family)
MARAVFNGTVIADSDDVVIVEGNVYFPPDALDWRYFRPTDHATVCGWKGTAGYYTVEADGQVAENAAWTYRAPKPEASNIKDFVAFYPIVTVER